jgi:hypothetical protein
MDIKNERLAKIQKEIKAKHPQASQRVTQQLTIAAMANEILSMELEISQWKAMAHKHQL